MSDDLMTQILASPRLPTPPALAARVLALCQQEAVSAADLAEVISADPALTSKVLRVVNSSLHGLRRPVPTVRQAVTLLGLDSVKALALGFSFLKAFGAAGHARFDAGRFSQRCLYAALGANALARRLHVEGHEAAFAGGLLQDLGVLALVQVMGAPYLGLLEQAGADRPLADLERQHLHMDHARLGAQLAENWNLGPALVSQIRFHHRPEDAPAPLQPLVRATAAGTRAAELLLQPTGDEQALALGQQLQTWFALKPEAAGDLVGEIAAAARDLGSLVELPNRPGLDPDALLLQANETLERLCLHGQETLARMADEQATLAAQTQVDALTRAANRVRLEAHLRQAFAAAVQRRRPLALLCVDIDGLGQINRVHGRAAGDRALQQVAAVLRTYVPVGGMAARYGGDEFVVTLPEFGQREAVELAERLRGFLAARPAPRRGSDGDAAITLTIGVVAQEEMAGFTHPEQLLAAADDACALAKAAGGDRVRSYAVRAADVPVTAVRRPLGVLPGQTESQPVAGRWI